MRFGRASLINMSDQKPAIFIYHKHNRDKLMAEINRTRYPLSRYILQLSIIFLKLIISRYNKSTNLEEFSNCLIINRLKYVLELVLEILTTPVLWLYLRPVRSY